MVINNELYDYDIIYVDPFTYINIGGFSQSEHMFNKFVAQFSVSNATILYNTGETKR